VTITTEWWVYVLQSQVPRFNKKHQPLPGFYYVGSTTDPMRRLQQHNGTRKGGGRYTAKHRDWRMMAIYGPYGGRSDAMKAERALKRGKRSTGRTRWTPKDSDWCRGLGVADPRIPEVNRACISALAANLDRANHRSPMMEPDGIVHHGTPKKVQIPHEKGGS